MDEADRPLLLANVRLLDGSTADVHLGAGRIQAVTATGAQDPIGEVIDLSGHLLLPAPAEPHCHFDKVLLGGVDIDRGPRGLDTAVTAWYAARQSISPTDVRDRALRAAKELLASGATAIRSHVDVGTETGLVFVEALQEVRRLLLGQLDLQIVAFVDFPLRGVAGADNRALLVDALAQGADAVGGAPYRDEDPSACLDILMETAFDCRKPVDLHIDETLDSDSHTLGALAEWVLRSGFPYRVSASHCVSLGTQRPDVVERTAAQVARAGIAVVTCPATNLYLQARAHPPPVPRGLTAIAQLRAAGVTVAAGGDNARDPFNPLGRFDPMEAASLLVLAGHLSPRAAYEAVSGAARRAMGLESGAVEPGSPAELLAVRASTVEGALADARADRAVFHRGRLVCRTRHERYFTTPNPKWTPSTDRPAGTSHPR
ncbi:amidohydrolase family protein [Streptomyces sp. NBC_00690]|uniref:amidohydrolase family protein n=1 Tax=Streptomyces sp. NBC_00690 TaxID=2975808 RepID=UPI002E2C6F75|nr:amidohydrolase family protein [Streptomyces sp. NBC_00690]